MASAIKRWANAELAKRHNVDAAVAKKISDAVKSAKKQGLQGGETVDAIERAIGRRLHAGEYSVADAAKKHHEHDPPGGYSGPRAKDAPDPQKVDEKKRDQAQRSAQMASNKIVSVAHGLQMRIDKREGSVRGEAYAGLSTAEKAEYRRSGELTDGERAKLREAVDDLEVAADAFEEAGPRFHVLAGTLRKRAEFAARGASSRSSGTAGYEAVGSVDADAAAG